MAIIDKKGVTLIELLVVLVISGIVIGGVYRVFISQTKAYSVQEQVAEIQQDVRGAMEIMVRDVRMSGSKHRNFDSPAIINNPILTPFGDTSITVNYEYNAATNTVTYALAGGVLTRTLNGTPEELLNNVRNLTFSYGIDADGNGEIDGIDEATGLTPNSAFKKAADVGTAKVLAVRIELIANPDPGNPDVAKVVSPRTLTSVVTPRNLYYKRYLEY
jgi:prepilin-type N-terminal cleavage/methylation domain-containing protein